MSRPVIDLNPLAPEPQLSESVRLEALPKRRIGNEHDKWNRAGGANAKTGTEMPMTGLTNSPLPPGRNCRPFPDQLASRSADDGSAKSWLGQAKRLEARRHCRSQCEDRALTEGHERSSLFLRKFRPAHSHHNASASWHEFAATRMQMFATGSNLNGRKPPAAEDAHRANRDISRVASPAWRPTETPRRSRQQPRDLETPPNGQTSEK